MPDKSAKPSPGAATGTTGDDGVLGNLSPTRPERIGSRRAPATGTGAPNGAGAATPEPRAKATPQPRAKAAPAKRRAKPATARRPAKATPAKRRAKAARSGAAAPHTFEPTAAAERAAGGGATAATADAPPRPRAVKKVAPDTGTPHRTGPPPLEREPEHGRPSGIELVATTVQAAGEVAQLGIAIGGRLLKRAAGRLPKP
jgi:hypothetical protein